MKYRLDYGRRNVAFLCYLASFTVLPYDSWAQMRRQWQNMGAGCYQEEKILHLGFRLVAPTNPNNGYSI